MDQVVVVGQPDPLAGVADDAVGERDEDGVAEGIGDQPEQHQEHRQHEQVARQRVAPAPAIRADPRNEPREPSAPTAASRIAALPVNRDPTEEDERRPPTWATA